MNILGLTFISPALLLGLLSLPLIWWLLRLTPPRPKEEVFPPTRILEEVAPQEETPAQSPWWLTLLRLAMAALIIVALADPIKNAVENSMDGEGAVLIILDDGWTAGPNWEARTASTKALLTEAGRSSRPVSLVLTSEGGAANLAATSADEALRKLAATSPKPVRIDLTALSLQLAETGSAFETIAWMASGLEQTGTEELVGAINAGGASEVLVYSQSPDRLVALNKVLNEPDALAVEVTRATKSDSLTGIATAYDIKGQSLSSAPFEFNADQNTTAARFSIPVELRNEIVRIAVDGEKSAGAVQLLDESFRRRRVGLISGGNADLAQPLLSPLYYISRALSPFSEVREASEANAIDSLNQLIREQTSTLIMADIGKLPDTADQLVSKWINNGGMLVRFAGPRLAAAENDELVPVRLRRGDRSLGGTLTWGTPQPLASFDANSPFAGITVPQDVTINRQVLAEPGIELEERTWASLADGTPLVTAAKRGKGWIVLFHVTADASWSNLPLSGAFVDMLRRIVAVSNGAIATADGAASQSATSATSGAAQSVAVLLPPLRNVDGFGLLGGTSKDAKPLAVKPGKVLAASLDNPPGFYGTSDAFTALNLFRADADLKPFTEASFPTNAKAVPYVIAEPFTLKPWLLLIAFVLLILDCIAVLWMAGALNLRSFGGRKFAMRSTAALIAMTCFTALPVDGVRAQTSSDPTSSIVLESVLKTRLAYVVTGDANLDTISRKGLVGLTDFISSRTSLEPGTPIGVDISSDELSFYPLLYWPLSSNSSVPDTGTMARVDAFMRKGGTVLFDTRDQLTGGFGGNQVSGATFKLRQILSSLDIPPLEPVPQNHVLTRAFYLLDVFPGRYLDGRLWVETSEDVDDPDRPTRQGDGVSSIIITSNDFAGAWAVETSGAPTLPVVPPNPTQRTYAYRTGVNIVMYMLTGNYKSDQVHIPALLERLGQ